MLVLRRAAAVALLSLSCGARTDLPVDGADDGQGGFDGPGGFGPTGGFGGEGGLCGDGLINGNEECDGQNLGGLDCTAFGFADPAGLVCDGCNLDEDGCHPTCGNFVLEPTEGCDDGNTINGDGCTSDCFSEEDACNLAIPVTLAPGTQSFFGALGGGANHAPTLGASCQAGAGAGPEAVYQVSVTEQGHVTAYLPSAGTGFNTVLYSRLTCSQQSSQLSCHDNDAGAGAGEVVSTWLEPGETVFLFVDTGGAAVGDYELVLDLSRGGSCADVPPVTIEGTRPIELLGRISSLADDASANGCSGAGTGPDAVWAFTFADDDTYAIQLQTSAFNSVSHIRSSCEDSGSEIACDSPGGTDNSGVSLSANANQTRFFWVDSVDTQAGPYTVLITH